MRFTPTDVICSWSLTAMAIVSTGLLMAGQ
jgi:hypothetical protein